jgi:hypothetical protein
MPCSNQTPPSSNRLSCSINRQSQLPCFARQAPGSVRRTLGDLRCKDVLDRRWHRLRRASDEALWLLRNKPDLAVRASLQPMVHRTLPAEPVVLQLVGAPGAAPAIAIGDFKNVNGPLTQVHQGFHAFRICAVIDHVSPSFCAAQPGPWPLPANVTDTKMALANNVSSNNSRQLCPAPMRRFGVTLVTWIIPADFKLAVQL